MLKRKNTVSFSEGNFPITDFRPKECFQLYETISNWHYVKLDDQLDFQKIKAIENWLNANVKNRYVTYNYNIPSINEDDWNWKNVMVIHFEKRNDAMYFKLGDGARAYNDPKYYKEDLYL